MIGEILISLVFFLLMFFLFLLNLKTESSFGVIQFAFFVVFVPGLHFARLFGLGTIQYDLTYYVLTYFVILAYLGLFTLGMFWVKRWMLPNHQIMQIARTLPERYLFLAFGGWLLLKGYLLVKYGAGAFGLLQGFSDQGSAFVYSEWWVKPITSYLEALAVGSSVIYVIKAATISRYWKNIGITGLFLLFAAVYVNVHESLIGPRRLIILLMLVAVAALVWRDGKKILRFTYWGKFLLPVLLALGLSIYYQTIRTNFYLPQVMALLRSPRPIDVAQGIFTAMVPLPEAERRELNAPFLREGPFEVIYMVAERLGDGHPGTRGAITKNAILMIVPRVVAGSSKTDLETDYILTSKMSFSYGPQFNYANPDVAMSLPAIFIADYGLLGGVLVPPLIVVIFIALFSRFPKFPAPAFSIFVLFSFGALLKIAGGAEQDLVAVLATLRDGLILTVILFLFSILKSAFSDKILR